ncbi:unnamed protein product, partial [Ectocarpus fasciculatus]
GRREVPLRGHTRLGREQAAGLPGGRRRHRGPRADCRTATPGDLQAARSTLRKGSRERHRYPETRTFVGHGGRFSPFAAGGSKQRTALSR